jgi:ABC-2 type transport system permease protein
MWRHRVRALIVKEMLAVFRDPRSRFVLVVPPLIQMVVFSFAATQEVRNVRMAVYDPDGGIAARELVSRFAGSRTFHSVRLLRGPREARDAIDSEDALLVLSIDPAFSRDLRAGRPARVQLILDGRRANAAAIVLGYATTIIQDFAQDARDRGGGASAQSRPAPGVRSVIVSRAWFNPNLSSVWNTVPALVGILTTLIGLLITALSVARERELGTFEQLLVSPLRPAEILVGKTVPAVALGFAEGLMMALIGRVVFGIPMVGSAWLLAGAIFVFLLAIVGVGLFISSLAKTQQQAILGAFTFMVPAVLLSGFATPVENMPPWLRWVTYGNPLRYFLVISRGVFLEGMNLDIAAMNLWPLAAIAVVTLGSASWLFRHRME